MIQSMIEVQNSKGMVVKQECLLYKLTMILIGKSFVNCQITYGTGHAKVYKITHAAFEYSSKTRELSLSTRGKLASCLRVLELPLHTVAVQCLASETDPRVQVLSCLVCYLIARMRPQLKAHKPSKKTPVQVV